MLRTARWVGLVLVLAAAATAWAAGVDGKWKAEFTGPDGQTRTNVFTFKVDGEKLTGSVLSSTNNEEAPIQNGTFKDDVVDFSIVRSFGGGELKLHYKGKVSGDTIPMTVSGDAGGQAFEFEITANRQK